ncbi:MAG: diacylglycerol kinase [Gammaproteobacteria bacterium]|nr:diacylglycerol kinase [Gammaproteobacteria bacterium]
MGKPGATGLRRIINAAGYSVKGFKAALKYESAFRQELALALVLTPTAFWLSADIVQTILLLGSLILVLMVELLNSAIEAVVDRIGNDHHVLAGRAKDMGSAAVFVSVMNVCLVWGLIIFQNYFKS